jgi:hypothetical protein
MCNEFSLSAASLCSVSGEIKRINSDAVTARLKEATQHIFLCGLCIEPLQTDLHSIAQEGSTLPEGK